MARGRGLTPPVGLADLQELRDESEGMMEMGVYSA